MSLIIRFSKRSFVSTPMALICPNKHWFRYGEVIAQRHGGVDVWRHGGIMEAASWRHGGMETWKGYYDCKLMI
jgi:hypothetical protein